MRESIRSLVLATAILLTAPLSWGGELEDLHTGLGLCKEALQTCEDGSLAHEELGQAKSEALEYYKKENADLRSAKDSIFVNPYLWAAIGIIVGVEVSK